MQDNPTNSGNAARWFESANANPPTSAFINDDPPYYMPRDLACARQFPIVHTPHAFLLGPTVAARLAHTISASKKWGHENTSSSNSNDFREVIDDLTVENKQLRSRLRLLERTHAKHLEEDKLFEVRPHDLAIWQKRRLEDAMRNLALTFAADPDNSNPVPAHQPAAVVHKTTTVPPMLKRAMNQPESATSFSARAQDSTYASMTASGPGSGSRAGSNTQSGQEMKGFTHQISDVAQDGLSSAAMAEEARCQASRVTQPMSDNAKKLIIVQRLESFFTHKGTDVFAPPQARVNTAPFPGIDHSGQSRATGEVTHPVPDSPSTDPIPTHIDLDAPKFSPGAEGEWFYLNFLSNMTQLHTLNVAPDFVRSAVKELSANLEVSRTGCKIRWNAKDKGEQPAQLLKRSRNEASDLAPKTTIASAHAIDGKVRKHLAESFAGGILDNNVDFVHYKPLFRQPALSDVDDDGTSLHSYQASPSQSRNNSPGATSQPALSKKEKPSYGPIIFYKRSSFCIDLSGDVESKGQREFNESRRHIYDACRLTDEVMGSASVRNVVDLNGEFPTHTFRAAPASPMESVASDGDAGSDDSLCPPPWLPGNNLSSQPPTELLEFEASGIPGIYPSDNLVFLVKTSRSLVPGSLSTAHSPPLLVQNLPQNPYSSPLPVAKFVRLDIISSEFLLLPPSPLPSRSNKAPSLTPSLPSVSSISTISSTFLEAASTPPHHRTPKWVPNTRSPPCMSLPISTPALAQPPSPITSLYPQNRPSSFAPDDSSSSNPEASGDDEDDEDDDDDSEIDFLATARQLDPEMVARRELEFEQSNYMFVDDLPVGSSAATAGGGSGFSSVYEGSHDSNASSDEYED
ncbi:MAG: hypothetical protein M1829_000927 [Trizodia sp. TS-e1964]|nr:MAG: hypothetical protein M1829_000927 [Trizodia sp. TS-e1964]